MMRIIQSLSLTRLIATEGLLPLRHNKAFSNKGSVPQCLDQHKRSLLTKESIGKPMTFVQAWEGLRGIAVLLTTACHCIHVTPAFHDFVGNAGVSIFFVLSGFLITDVLIKQQSSYLEQKGRYKHLPKFFMDRLIRLYPALLGMMIITSFLKVMQFGWPRNNLFVQIMVVIFYLSDMNIGGPSIWGTTYSLAIEKQFYIFWSLTLPWILHSKTHRWRKLLIGSLILPSFILYVCGSLHLGNLPIWMTSYRSPFSTVWKMLIGAWIRLHPLSKQYQNRATGWAGLLLLSLGILACVPKTPVDFSYIGISNRYIGHKVLRDPIAVLSTVLIITGTLSEGNALLEHSILRFLGRVSYSLYLYQRPIQYLTISGNSLTTLSTACLALVLAVLSTLYMEEPIRKWYRLKCKQKMIQAQAIIV